MHMLFPHPISLAYRIFFRCFIYIYIYIYICIYMYILYIFKTSRWHDAHGICLSSESNYLDLLSSNVNVKPSQYIPICILEYRCVCVCVCVCVPDQNRGVQQGDDGGDVDAHHHLAVDVLQAEVAVLHLPVGRIIMEDQLHLQEALNAPFTHTHTHTNGLKSLCSRVFCPFRVSYSDPTHPCTRCTRSWLLHWLPGHS